MWPCFPTIVYVTDIVLSVDTIVIQGAPSVLDVAQVYLIIRAGCSDDNT